MKKQFTQFKKDLKHILVIMCLATIPAYILGVIIMNIDKIINLSPMITDLSTSKGDVGSFNFSINPFSLNYQKDTGSISPDFVNDYKSNLVNGNNFLLSDFVLHRNLDGNRRIAELDHFTTNFHDITQLGRSLEVDSGHSFCN